MWRRVASTAAGSRSGPSPRLAGCVDGLLAPNSAASEPLRHTLDFVGAASQKEPGTGILPNSAAHWQSHWHASPAQCASPNPLKALETFAVPPCRERNIYYPRIQSADPIGRTRFQTSEFHVVSSMVQGSLTLRWAYYGSQGKKTRVVRSRNSGSEILKLQSVSWGNTQKLRSLFPALQRRATRPPWRVRLLLPLARHGVTFRDRRPRLRTAKCSQFLPQWPGTCQTQRQISLDHRSTPSIIICPNPE